jgi:quinol monooxygenase YgiN
VIIVSGRIYLAPGTRSDFLADSHLAMRMARRAPGCRDFVVAADTLEAERVNVYEEWDSAEELEAFRGEGTPDAMAADIVRADVARHLVASSGPA